MEKQYRLEKDSQFWEIQLNDEITTIKAGKKGCKGRKYPSKHHATHLKAKQFALQQVNSKIIQGFVDPSAPKLTKLKSVRRSNSMRLVKQRTLARTNSIKKDWRKPPKKSDTIRKLSRQSTILLSCPSLTPRRTLNKTQSNASTVSTSEIAAESQTAGDRKWRKPPKKQSTIRRLANRQPSVKKSPSLRKTLFLKDKS